MEGSTYVQWSYFLSKTQFHPMMDSVSLDGNHVFVPHAVFHASTSHLLTLGMSWCVFVYQVKSGEIPMDKVPYMQRGGAWDNSDLTKKGAAKMAARKEVVVNNNTTSKKITKKAWSDTDKAYANVRMS